MGEQPRNTKTKARKKSFGYPPIPTSTKWRPTVYRCPKTPKTSWTYPNIMGQKKRQGWVRYGQLVADNMIFIHMKFQYLQQKRAGVRFEVQNNKDGKDLGD